MARPKLGKETKVKINLTVNKDVRKMLNELSQEQQKSISEIFETLARKEYEKLQKKREKSQK